MEAIRVGVYIVTTIGVAYFAKRLVDCILGAFRRTGSAQPVAARKDLGERTVEQANKDFKSCLLSDSLSDWAPIKAKITSKFIQQGPGDFNRQFWKELKLDKTIEQTLQNNLKEIIAWKGSLYKALKIEGTDNRDKQLAADLHGYISNQLDWLMHNKYNSAEAVLKSPIFKVYEQIQKDVYKKELIGNSKELLKSCQTYWSNHFGIPEADKISACRNFFKPFAEEIYGVNPQ